MQIDSITEAQEWLANANPTGWNFLSLSFTSTLILLLLLIISSSLLFFSSFSFSFRVEKRLAMELISRTMQDMQNFDHDISSDVSSPDSTTNSNGFNR